MGDDPQSNQNEEALKKLIRSTEEFLGVEELQPGKSITLRFIKLGDPGAGYVTVLVIWSAETLAEVQLAFGTSDNRRYLAISWIWS